MASQHFYSRVPARVSMFNRTDCFDTFACSSDIGREFCEKELSNICNIALSAEDVEEIRLGKKPPIYAQFSAKTGELIQSCLTFLPIDYSGERSAYLVHSLVFKEEEKNALLANPLGPILNPERFVRDISSFSITDPAARPDQNYPAYELEKATLEKIPFPEPVTGDMRRRWVGAVLALLCGKIKTLFVSSPAGQTEEQNAFLCALFNATLHILPYHLRSALSLATCVSNQNQLPTFRIRGTTLLPEQIKLSKTAVISFDKKTLAGLSDDEITKQLREINFLCSISEQNPVREEFLRFCEHVVSLAPSLATPTIQSISDLILLFQSGCEYEEYRAQIPNDDAVFDLITLYDKNRKAIPDAYRIQTLRVLERYPKEHREIPKKVFSKVVKMYPSELYGSRRLILDIVLELIHTDLMRDKLMRFLGSIIDKEDPEAQADIALHLSRVLYGGFLQSQILSLFSELYPYLDEATGTVVLEKILLIIRTKSVQEQIISFLNEHYDEMPEPQKKMVLDAVFEQLEEGDELALSLISFLDQYAVSASDEQKEDLKQRICAEIDRERKRSDFSLVCKITNLSGYFALTVAEYILFVLFEKKIFRVWLKSVFSVSWSLLIKNLDVLCDLTAKDEALTAELAGALLEQYTEKPIVCPNLEEALNAWPLFENRSGALAETIRENILSVQLRRFLRAALSPKKQEASMESILERVSSIRALSTCEEANDLRRYLELRAALEQTDLAKLCTLCDAFFAKETCRADVAASMKKDLEACPNTAPLLVVATLLQHWLGAGKCGIDEEYPNLVSKVKEPPQKSTAKTEAAATEKASFYVMRQILITGIAVLDDQTLSESLRSAFLAPDSGLREALDSFLRQYGIRLKPEIERFLVSLKKPENEFVKCCKNLLDEVAKAQPKRGLFALFGSSSKKH